MSNITDSKGNFIIDENTFKNPFLLAEIKKVGSLRKLAQKMHLSPTTISLALNNKLECKATKIRIAKFFNKDTIEIFD